MDWLYDTFLSFRILCKRKEGQSGYVLTLFLFLNCKVELGALYSRSSKLLSKQLIRKASPFSGEGGSVSIPSSL